MLKFTWVKLLGPFEISGSFDSELISLRIPSLWSGTPLQHAEYSPSHQTATTEKKEKYIYIYIYIYIFFFFFSSRCLMGGTVFGVLQRCTTPQTRNPQTDKF